MLKKIEELKEKEKELLRSCTLLKKNSAPSNIPNRKRKDTRKVNTRDISICERLGSGFSGAVVYSCIVDGLFDFVTLLVLIISKGWVCAMKQLTSENKIDLESFEREMDILYRLPSHPNIVRCKLIQVEGKICSIHADLFHNTVNGKLCLYMTRHATTLQKVIHTNRRNENTFSEHEILSIASKIISGIEFLHENQIIHRDIKVCVLPFHIDSTNMYYRQKTSIVHQAAMGT